MADLRVMPFVCPVLPCPTSAALQMWTGPADDADAVEEDIVWLACQERQKLYPRLLLCPPRIPFAERRPRATLNSPAGGGGATNQRAEGSQK